MKKLLFFLLLAWGWPLLSVTAVAQTTLPNLTASAGGQDSDLFYDRQTVAPYDFKITGAQLKAYLLAGAPGYAATGTWSAAQAFTAASGTFTGIFDGVALAGAGTLNIGSGGTLGSAAFQATSAFAPAGSYLTGNQTITLSGAISGSGATAITTTLAAGSVGIGNLSASGTPSSTTYLRGDNTWASGGASYSFTSPLTLTGTNVGLPTVGTGTKAVMGSTDSSQDMIVTPSGTTTSIVLNPGHSVLLPDILIPIGPASAAFLFEGDSLIAGVGGGGLYTPQQIGGGTPTTGPYTGQRLSVPDIIASNPTFQNSVNSIYNLGTSGQTVFNAAANFNASGASTTATITINTGTIVVASTSGISSGQYIAASNNGIPFGTTVTSATTGTIVLSNKVTATGTVTISVANGNGYGSSLSFTTSPALLSESVTGTTTYAIIPFGTNSYWTAGITASGTATTASGTITGLSINSSLSFSGASISSSLNGDEVYGGSGATNGMDYTDLGSGVFTGTTVVVSNAGAVLGSMTTFKFEPQITGAGSDGNSAGTANTSTLTTNYLNLVNQNLALGNQVMVCTLYPFVNSASGYTQGQYDEQRLKFNSWLRTTFGTGTYTNSTTNTVTLSDSGLIPQLQYIGNAQYQNYRNQTGNNPHLNALGYSIHAAQLSTAFAANYPTAISGYASALAQGGMSGPSMPLDVIRIGQKNWSTGNTSVLGGGVMVLNQQLVCGVNVTGQQISGDGFEVVGANTSLYEDANGSGQLMLRGLTTPNKFLKLGNDTTNNHGYLDAEWSGTGSEPIYINPTGQQPLVVGYGNTYSNDGNMLQVDGVGEFNGNLVFDAAGQTIKVKGGSNAASGTITLSSGTGSVISSAVQAGDSIGLSPVTFSGVSISTAVYPMALAGTGSITFLGAAADNSTWKWWVVHTNQ